MTDDSWPLMVAFVTQGIGETVVMVVQWWFFIIFLILDLRRAQKNSTSSSMRLLVYLSFLEQVRNTYQGYGTWLSWQLLAFGNVCCATCNYFSSMRIYKFNASRTQRFSLFKLCEYVYPMSGVIFSAFCICIAEVMKPSGRGISNYGNAGIHAESTVHAFPVPLMGIKVHNLPPRELQGYTAWGRVGDMGKASNGCYQ